MIGRFIKWVLVLCVLIFLIILGYAVFGDFRAPEGEIRQPVILDVD